ncbi:MAG: hypothetical protein ACRDYZ_07865 [Acidimicrobiales bacterium]
MTQPTVQPTGQQARAGEGPTTGVAREPADEEATALDLLEEEDHRVLELASTVGEDRERLARDVGDARVHRQVGYGNRAKLLVRHLATRETAARFVTEGVAGTGELEQVARRLASGGEERRQRLNRAEAMSRNVQGMNLNAAQDFDRALDDVLAAVRPQIEWELGEGLPAVREALGPTRCREAFPSARYVARHAPTRLGDRPWHERVPGVSRAVAAVHHLRDFSRSTRDAKT